jgi:L-iditol 2-dehydrogenase
VDLVRKRGRICAIGLTGNRPVELPWDKFQFKVVDLQFCLSTEYESWDRTIHLVASGAVPAEKVVTHCEPLDRWEQVFDAIENLQALKGVLLPL